MRRSTSHLTIASRGSKLALAQANLVADLVRARHPSIDIDVRIVTTRGDRDQRSFAAIDGKGIFVGEVEREVVEGRADVAVHSAKDLTAQLAPGCTIVCMPVRAAVYDVVIGGEGETGEERLGSLPPGSAIGTSSIRRRALLAEIRGDLDVVEFRGNVDTRLAKMGRGEVAATILARAGLDRLGVDVPVAPLDPDRWIPPPGQGALAVEALAERVDVAGLFEPFDDPRTRAEWSCERAYADVMEGGCSVPLGCTARADDEGVVATGFLGAPDGGQTLRDRISGPLADAASLGRELAHAILGAGGDDILADLRDAAVPTPSPP